MRKKILLTLIFLVSLFPMSLTQFGNDVVGFDGWTNLFGPIGIIACLAFFVGVWGGFDEKIITPILGTIGISGIVISEIYNFFTWYYPNYSSKISLKESLRWAEQKFYFGLIVSVLAVVAYLMIYKRVDSELKSTSNETAKKNGLLSGAVIYTFLLVFSVVFYGRIYGFFEHSALHTYYISREQYSFAIIITTLLPVLVTVIFARYTEKTYLFTYVRWLYVVLMVLILISAHLPYIGYFLFEYETLDDGFYVIPTIIPAIVGIGIGTLFSIPINKISNKIKRDIFAPEYYNDFKCTASECRHSCCVGWDIIIDEGTLLKYRNVPEIMETVTDIDGDKCFKLKENGRCPHLNDKGLCDIIISHGEEYLSEICQKHPRFFNETGGRIEAGLGIACEEALKLVLEKPFSLVKIGESKEVYEASDFNPLPERDKILKTDGSFAERLKFLKEKYEIPQIYSFDEWVDRFLSFEILTEEWKLLLGRVKEKSPMQKDGYDEYYNRLLAYFIYRHVSASESRDNLKARLGFAILSAEMIKGIFERSEEKLSDIARMYSAEIEYSEDNTAELIFEFECMI